MAYLSLPDGSYYEIPKGMNAQQAFLEAYKKYPQAFGVQAEAPAKAKEPGVIESGIAGAKKLLSSQRTAIESPFGTEEAARAGVARARELEEKTPSALSLEKVKEKYAKEGFFPAAGEVLRQAPGFIAEQSPQLAEAFAGGRLGAMAGAPLGPGGSLAGGIAGAITPLFLQAYGAGAERRAAEGLQQDPGKTALSATGQAGLEYASMVIPLGGKLMRSILGLPAREAEQALLSPAARKLAEERLATSIAKGTAGGVLANIPTEVSQQMLERWQANMPLMDDAAIKEYSEAAYGATLFGGPFGGVGRRAQVGQAREDVTRADALEAAKQARALQEAEAARKATPEYALDVGDRFEALQQQEKALLAARGKKLGKDATDEQKEAFAQQTEELQALRNQLKELAPAYKEVKPRLSALREELRVAGITPQQYQLEQMGLAEEPAAAVPEARTMADLQAPAPFEAESPTARLEKDTEDALAGLQYYNNIQPLSNDDLRNGAVDILMRNPARAQALVDNDLPIPGFSAKESRTIISALRLQLKNAPKAALTAEKEALQRMGADVRGQREMGEVGRLFNQIESQQRDFEKEASEQRTEQLAGDLAGTLSREAKQRAPGVVVESGLQKQNYKEKANDFAEQADDTFVNIKENLDKIATGMTLDSSRPDMRKFASTTSDILRQQALEAKPRYIDAVMNELANQRAAEGQQPITAEAATRATAQMNAALDAFINQQASEKALARQLDVIRARVLTAAPELRRVETPVRRQSQKAEAEKIAEARGETAKTLEGQLRRQRDYVGGVLGRALQTRPVTDKDTRALLTQVQDSIEDGTATREMLDVAEDYANRALVGKPTETVVTELASAMRSMQQAQGPGIEGGQRALFGAEDLGVVRASAANFQKFLKSQQVAKLRALLPQVRQATPGVDPDFYRARIDALEKRITEAKEELEDVGDASWESIMQTRAVLPEEVRQAKQKLYALMQEQNALEMVAEEAANKARKQKLSGTRGPYEAAQAEDKARKLKDQLRSKETNILETMRDLTAQIRAQRGQAIYGPIIQRFEQQAKIFETRLAELKAAMPEDARMSPDFDELFNEAAELEQEIKVTREGLEEARFRASRIISYDTEFDKEALAAAEQALLARQSELRTAKQKPNMSVSRIAELERQVEKATEKVDDFKKQRREANKEFAEGDTRNEALLAAADERIVREKAKLKELQDKLAKVDLVGDARRQAQTEANKQRAQVAIAEKELATAKEVASKQAEEFKRRAVTGEGMRKLTRTVVPVERVTPSGKRIVLKEKGTGLPVQQKKTTGAFSEREPVKGLDWKTTKESKPRIAPTAETAEAPTPKAQRVGAAENLKDLAETSRALAQQEKVTDIKPKPKKVEPLRTASAEAKEEKLTRKQTAAEKRKLARDLAEGVVSEYDDDAGLAFRTAKALTAPVDPAEAKKLIVETLSTLPKGVNLVYVPTLEGMNPETLKRLVSFGYKPGSAFKGVVLPDDGTIVVVGDQHTNVKDLEETLFHEMVGHYGIDTVIGMDRLKTYAGATDLEKLAKKLGGDQLWTHAVDAMTFATEQKGDPDLAALREIIAYTAQQRVTENFKQKAGRWLQELVGMVRSALRQMGFKNMAEMSTSDVFYAIKMANKAFNERTVGPYRAEGGVMAFRTKTEPSRYGGSFVGSQKGAIDNLRGNMLGLSGRVQFVDQYAALDAAMKKGLDAGVISDLEAEQAGYYLRFGQQANAYATQALTNGPLSLVKQVTKRGMEFFYSSTPGASMTKVAQALEKSGIKNSTELEQMFTIYVAGKRAKQLTGGWNKLNFSNPATAEADYNRLMAELKGNDKARTAFEEAAKIYKEYNNGLIDFLVQTGYMSASRAAELKAIDYVPFYRVKNGELQLMVDKERPVRIANVKDEPMLHELVGDNTQILPIFTSSAQNAFVLTRMGLRNQMMKDNVMLLGRLGIASKIGKGQGPQGPNTVRYKVKGEDNFAVIDSDQYGIPAELIVKGMEGIKTTIPMAIKVMGLPANWLRKLVTRNPAYAIRQAIRDPLTAWFTTGTDGVPVLNSFIELSKMVAGRSPEEIKLMQAGAISSNVMTGDEQDMARAMRDMSLGRTGWAKLMMKADALAMQGDAATRAVIYKDSLAKGMSEMQAYMRTLESMNFNRRGLSPSMQMLSVVIPFFNAQIQGLDVLYRAFTGQMPYSDQLKIRQKLYTRGLLLAAGTLAYAAAMEDDEAYKRAKPEERLGNWFVYTPFSKEPMKIPIPFELGYLFKALPEAVFNTAAEDERASDITKGMGKLVALSNPFALPAAIKPGVEVILGKSFFGGDIESMREKTTMMPGERYREGTTEVAKLLGSVTGNAGLTPIKIDHLIRGHTGALGIAIASLANPILNTEASAVEKPTMKTSKMPFIGGLFQPVEGRGTLDAAYERILEVEQVQGTYKRLAESGKKEEAREFLDKYRNKLVSASLSGEVRQQLGELSKIKRQVLESNRTTAEKDELLERIDDRQYRLAQRFLSVTGETRPQ